MYTPTKGIRGVFLSHFSWHFLYIHLCCVAEKNGDSVLRPNRRVKKGYGNAF